MVQPTDKILKSILLKYGQYELALNFTTTNQFFQSKAMDSPIQLRINLDFFKSVLLEGDSTGISTYIDTKTGETLLASDMLVEEIQERKRYFQVPSKKIWSISQETVMKWIEEMLGIFTQEYGEDAVLKIRSELDQAVKQSNYIELVEGLFSDLQSEGIDDKYFLNWLDFLQKEEENNIRSWLFSKGIDLVN
jgi:hypothetical protein